MWNDLLVLAELDPQTAGVLFVGSIVTGFVSFLVYLYVGAWMGTVYGPNHPEHWRATAWWIVGWPVCFVVLALFFFMIAYATDRSMSKKDKR